MTAKPFRHPQLTELDRVARARRKQSRENLDLDVEAFIREVKALPVFKDCPRSITRTKVVFTHTAFVSGGYSHGQKMARVRATFAPAIGDTGKAPADIYLERVAWLLDTIVHELVHCALPDRTVHNERFRRTLARAVRELWGFEVDPNPKSASGRVARYGLDDVIERHLEECLRNGTLTYPKLVRAAPEDAASVKEAARRAQKTARAAHASKMLARAETRLRRAETIAKKWRARVKRLNSQITEQGEQR